ncbi:MAG: hypothetical protein K5761_08360 [Clostridiales bacterium]|nr:hypothetical protein [Clostridiales bacterium]
MRKINIIVLTAVLLILMLGGCTAGEQNNMENKSVKTITVTNEIENANIWILAQTEENLKTTLWGEATVSDIKTGETKTAKIKNAGAEGLYILRIIDEKEFYYSADNLKLENGYKIKIKKQNASLLIAEISDEKGNISTYELFSARL